MRKAKVEKSHLHKPFQLPNSLHHNLRMMPLITPLKLWHHINLHILWRAITRPLVLLQAGEISPAKLLSMELDLLFEW
jgi:hypothetical protein